MEKPTKPEGAERDADERARRQLLTMLRLGIAWALVYLVLQEPNGWFARTAERVDLRVLTWTVFNVPLHLVLLVAASLFVTAGGRSLRVGLWIGRSVVLLVVAHVVISAGVG